jgi:SAM-dependent MidA family methyltransferase
VPEALADLIRAEGPLSFERYMEWALYEPAHGFFALGGGAGRRGGDFLTSPEVGALFGAVVAAWLDAVWDRMGRPDPFTVVEAGAGRGALAIAVRAAAPRCASSMHYVMVERSEALRTSQREHLDVVDPPEAFPAPGGGGPRFYSMAEMPTGRIRGVVLANELLDNLPFRLVECGEAGWSEVLVDLGPDGGLRESTGGLPEGTARRCESLAPHAGSGARFPLQDRASEWVCDVLERLEGELILFDYASTSAEMAARSDREWLRTYRGHTRGGAVLDEPGSQDITAEVAIDQLPLPASAVRQRDWLVDNGIEAMVEAARGEWSERAGVGDLRAMRARSVPVEAEALCDPSGLGAFWVLEWRCDAHGRRE